MSASLVGSEMCIRDRSPLRAKQTVSHVLNTRRAPLQAQRQLHNGADTPVSYTHLTLPTICSV
eukprot:14359109-Alexandrium_andersonii.AAC.1